MTKERFRIPSESDVKNYALSLAYNINAPRFILYYEQKGWMIGKSPMKSWKAAIRLWRMNADENENFKVFKGTTLPEWVVAGHFLGPCIVTDKETALISHPEHSNVALGAGTYQIQHQLDVRTMQRVRD